MKTKTLTVMAIAMLMAAPTNAKNKAKKTDAAARLTRGSVIKYESVKSPIENTICIAYHIDENGDGNADVVRNRIQPTNEPFRMQSPFTKMEFFEMYDPVYHTWNIVKETRIGTTKPAKAPVYTPEKTR